MDDDVTLGTGDLLRIVESHLFEGGPGEGDILGRGV